MRVFEFHFNPKSQEDKIFDSFIYESELYMAGELSQALPQNSQFLNNLALTIKREYRTHSSLGEVLKKANEFLEKEAKAENVSWLGNLNFAVLSFKDFILNFTKVGNIKILLQREGELLDIGQNLEFQDTEPYPLKIFGNIAEGKLAQNDKVIILTKNVFSALTQKGNFFTELSRISDQKELKKLLKINKSILSEISGICLLLMVNEECPTSKIPVPKIKLPAVPKIKLPAPVGQTKKNLILILVLLSILAGSFFAFNSGRQEEFQNAKSILSTAKSKAMMAENFLILKDEEKARALFEEARDALSPLTKIKTPLSKEALILQKSIDERLESEF